MKLDTKGQNIHSQSHFCVTVGGGGTQRVAGMTQAGPLIRSMEYSFSATAPSKRCSFPPRGASTALPVTLLPQDTAPGQENGATSATWGLSFSQNLCSQQVKERAGRWQRAREGSEGVCRNALYQRLLFSHVWSIECGLIRMKARSKSALFSPATRHGDRTDQKTMEKPERLSTDTNLQQHP